MAFPQVAATNTSQETANTTTHTISLPSGIVADSLVLVFVSTDGDISWSNLNGFTELFSANSGTAASLSVMYKYCAGGETTVDFVSNESEQSSHISWRITGDAGSGTPPVVSASNTASSQYPDPLTLSPTGGAADYLWIAVEGHDHSDTTSAYPLPDNNSQNTNNGSQNSGVAVCSDELNQATLDPTTFTLSGTEQWAACTVAVYPVAAVIVDLDGTGGAVADVNGDFVRTRGEVGSSEAVVDVDGEIDRLRDVDGDSIAEISANGDLDRLRELDGSTISEIEITGALDVSAGGDIDLAVSIVIECSAGDAELHRIQLRTIKSAGGDYSDFASWESDVQGDLRVGTGNDTEQWGEFYAMEDTSSASITGSDTDEDHFFYAYVADGEKHSNKWDTGKYYLNRSNGHGLQVYEAYTRINGFQVTHHSLTADYTVCSFGNTAANSWLGNTIIKGANDSARVEVGLQFVPAGAIFNVIVYDIDPTQGSGCRAISTNGTTVYAYSSTFLDGNYCVVRSGGTLVMKNCYASANWNGDYFGSPTLTTCASGDTSGSVGLQEIAADANNFIDVGAGTEDFHITDDSELKDVGTDLSGESVADGIDLTVDGEGQARVSWDIGADEHIFKALAGLITAIISGESDLTVTAGAADLDGVVETEAEITGELDRERGIDGSVISEIDASAVLEVAKFLTGDTTSEIDASATLDKLAGLISSATAITEVAAELTVLVIEILTGSINSEVDVSAILDRLRELEISSESEIEVVGSLDQLRGIDASATGEIDVDGVLDVLKDLTAGATAEISVEANLEKLIELLSSATAITEITATLITLSVESLAGTGIAEAQITAVMDRLRKLVGEAVAEIVIDGSIDLFRNIEATASAIVSVNGLLELAGEAGLVGSITTESVVIAILDRARLLDGNVIAEIGIDGSIDRLRGIVGSTIAEIEVLGALTVAGISEVVLEGTVNAIAIVGATLSNLRELDASSIAEIDVSAELKKDRPFVGLSVTEIQTSALINILRRMIGTAISEVEVNATLDFIHGLLGESVSEVQATAIIGLFRDIITQIEAEISVSATLRTSGEPTDVQRYFDYHGERIFQKSGKRLFDYKKNIGFTKKTGESK